MMQAKLFGSPSTPADRLLPAGDPASVELPAESPPGVELRLRADELTPSTLTRSTTRARRRGPGRRRCSSAAHDRAFQRSFAPCAPWAALLRRRAVRSRVINSDNKHSHFPNRPSALLSARTFSTLHRIASARLGLLGDRQSNRSATRGQVTSLGILPSNLRGSNLQPPTPDCPIRPQLFRRSPKYDGAVPHNIDPGRDCECDVELLLDE
jgi:hypothetical protein